jgi:hypothetical protein
MVDKMTDTHNATLPADIGDRHELGIGAGASIVVAVATSIVLLLALLIASHASPAGAAELAETTTQSSGAISGIVVIAVLAAWLRVSADLWRAVFNRVRRWDLFRV